MRSLTSIQMFHTHTPPGGAFFGRNVKLSKRSEAKTDTARYVHMCKQLRSVLEGRSRGEGVGLATFRLSRKSQSRWCQGECPPQELPERSIVPLPVHRKGEWPIVLLQWGSLMVL